MILMDESRFLRRTLIMTVVILSIVSAASGELNLRDPEVNVYGNTDLLTHNISGIDMLKFSPFNGGIEIGEDAEAESELGQMSIAIGESSKAPEHTSIAIGDRAEAPAHFSTTVGFLSDAISSKSTSFGHFALSSGEGATTVGANSESDGEDTIAIGENTLAENPDAIAIGADSAATGSATVCVDECNDYGGSIALGADTESNARASIAIGRNAVANEPFSAAIGYGAEANEVDSVALGPNSRAENMFTIAVGNPDPTTSTYDLRVHNGDIIADGGDIRTVDGGSKNFVHQINKTHNAVYTSQESGEVRAIWEESSILIENGEEKIETPAHFREVTSENEPLITHVTPEKPVAVAAEEKSNKVIRIKTSSKSDVRVDLTVKGVRKGFENKSVLEER